MASPVMRTAADAPTLDEDAHLREQVLGSDSAEYDDSRLGFFDRCLLFCVSFFTNGMTERRQLITFSPFAGKSIFHGNAQNEYPHSCCGLCLRFLLRLPFSLPAFWLHSFCSHTL
jgi:hypothetical protein